MFDYLKTIATSELTQVLVCLSALDWITGLISSFILKTTSSKVGLNGIFRKVLMYISLVAVALVGFAFETMVPLLVLFKSFLIFNEIISITENAVECGVELPDSIMNIFKDERARYEQARELKHQEY